MFLGPAAVGKTSLRHGLMNQPLPDKPDYTILAQTRPVKYFWVKIDSDHKCMAEVTEEDELDEEVQLIFGAGDNPDTFLKQLSCIINEPCDQRLEVQSHEEVLKHKQQVLAKAAQMQSQQTRHQEMWLHLWDCGGQPVFLDVLPAFLSSRTVFLLMFDAARGLHSPFRVSIFNKGERKDAVSEITTLSQLQKWIALIHARFGDTEQQRVVPGYPRIILVGTHGDQLAPGQPVEEKKRIAAEILHQLNASLEGKEYADMVLGTGLVVDNTTAGKGAMADSGFRELHSAISAFVQEKLSTETPFSWVHFRKVLQLHIKKKPVIKLEEVYGIAAECHVPEGEVHSALLFYHELGVFLFYPNIEGFESVVILEPRWLVDRFGELFASWKGKAEYRDMWNTLTQYGVLVEPLYKAVLSNVYEHSLTPDALVKMLEHFFLVAPIVTSRLHDKSGKVKEYFVPHMLQLYCSQSSTSPHSAKPKIGKVKAFFSFSRYTSSRTHQDAQSSAFKEAAPIHITFLSGYVPPGYYVRLATSLASKDGVMVLFHTGIYRNQISMDIGVDRLTITEHTETIELQFSRQESIKEPFRESCQRLLMLLNECFSEVCRWLPGANVQLAFSCLKCSQSPQPGVSTRVKLCLFTLEQHTNQYLHCQVGHKTMPSPSQKYWLKYEMNAIQQEQVLFEEKIHLTKPGHPEAVLNLAKQLDVDPLSAVIHQYRRIGGDDEELVHILSDMKLTTCSRSDVSQSISDASQPSTAAPASLTASQALLQDTERMDRFSLSGTETARSSRQIASSDAATQQLKPLNRPPEYLDLLIKVATRTRDKWKNMGLQLNIPMNQLNSVTTTDPIGCYADVFNWWQRNGSPPYTWATIIDALRAPIVGEVQLASELEEWITTVQAPAAAMPTFAHLRGVHVVGEKLFQISGEFSQLLEWEEYGLRIQVPKGATSTPCDIAIKAIVAGQFEFPEGTDLVSAVYAISMSKKLSQPVILEMQHCVAISSQEQGQFLSFVRARCNQPDLPYQFKLLKKSEFPPHSDYGKISCNRFSIVGIVLGRSLLSNAMIGHSFQVNKAASNDSECPPVKYTAYAFYINTERNTWKMHFNVTKALDALIQQVKKEHDAYDVATQFQFQFCDYGISLNLEKQCTDKGWSILPAVYPCELLKQDVDNWTNATPSCCHIEVQAEDSSDTATFLRYYAPVCGIIPKNKRLLISRRLQSTDAVVHHKITRAPKHDKARILRKPPEFHQLLQKVGPKVKAKWKTLGHGLRIECHQLDAIERDNSECLDRLVKMLQQWKKNTDPPYTWATIIEALKSPLVDEENLAKELECSPLKEEK